MIIMSRFFDDLKIKNRQNYVNKLYAEEGLTDNLLERQIEINKRRHDLDIPDKKHIIYTDKVNKEYVQ